MRMSLFAIALAAAEVTPSQPSPRSFRAPAETRFAVMDLALRETRNSASRALLAIPRGNGVLVLDCLGAWCKVRVGPVTGFVPERQLVKVRPDPPTTGRGVPSPAPTTDQGPWRTPFPFTSFDDRWVRFIERQDMAGAYDSAALRFVDDTALVAVRIQHAWPTSIPYDHTRHHTIMQSVAKVHCVSRRVDVIRSVLIGPFGDTLSGYPSRSRGWIGFEDDPRGRMWWVSLCPVITNVMWRSTVRVTARHIEVRFPSITLARAGCQPMGNSRTDSVRRYQWRIVNYFPDGLNMRNYHFMAASLSFGLPAGVPLTRERMDSAFASVPLQMYEATGEPAMPVRWIKPSYASARWDSRGVRFVIEDSAAARAFLAAGRDSVHVQWCQLDRQGTGVWRPIQR